MSTYIALFRQLQNEEYLQRAFRATDAVLRSMNDNGALASVVGPRGHISDQVFIFDQAMMSNGLMEFAIELDHLKHKKASEILQKALKSIDFIIGRLRSGCWTTQYTMGGEKVDSQDSFFLGKCAQPLVKAYQVTGEDRFVLAAQDISNHVIERFLSKDGAFRMDGPHIWNRMHYHCYAIEGLLSVSEVVTDPLYNAVAFRAAMFLRDQQKDNGGFWNRSSSFENDGLEDVPVAAQAIRIWRHYISADASLQSAIEKAYAYLASLQYTSVSKHLDGGFPFMLPRRLYRRWACSWACIFFIDSHLPWKPK